MRQRKVSKEHIGGHETKRTFKRTPKRGRAVVSRIQRGREVVLSTSVLLFLVVIFFSRVRESNNLRRHSILYARGEEGRLALRLIVPGQGNSFKSPQAIIEPSSTNEYGGLEFRLLLEGQQRQILDFLEEPIISTTAADEPIHQYYAFDDDYLRSSYMGYAKRPPLPDNQRCRRVSWHRLHFPICNSFHELSALSKSRVLINSGGFYDVFNATGNTDAEHIALKQLRYQWDFAYANYEAIRMDALISERLTSRQRIVNIFGHCGVTTLAEVMDYGDLNGDFYRRNEDLKSAEDPYQSLLLAAEAAHALGSLHGYPDGTIVHGDFSLVQVLFDDTGRVKLDDFNRAEILLYNEANSTYCKYDNSDGFSLRSPEEYMSKPVDESADVYSFGASLYTVLMGEYLETDVRIIRGRREFEETVGRQMLNATKLVNGTNYATFCVWNVTEKCVRFDPEDRPTMVEVVDYLEGCIDVLEATKNDTLVENQ